VRATPRAAADAIDGMVKDADGRERLAVRLTAAPSDGAANDALVRLLAKALGVRKKDVSLTGGAASRLKRLHIKGDPATLSAAIADMNRGQG